MQLRVATNGIDIAPEMAARLRALAQHPKDNDAEIKNIGQDLHDIGGLEAMQEFFGYACLGPRASRDVQIAWHGVGDWQY